MAWACVPCPRCGNAIWVMSTMPYQGVQCGHCGASGSVAQLLAATPPERVYWAPTSTQAQAPVSTNAPTESSASQALGSLLSTLTAFLVIGGLVYGLFVARIVKCDECGGDGLNVILPCDACAADGNQTLWEAFRHGLRRER